MNPTITISLTPEGLQVNVGASVAGNELLFIGALEIAKQQLLGQLAAGQQGRRIIEPALALRHNGKAQL